jgi:hypothetical protein
MRNAACMNDYSEMRFGLERMQEAYASPPGMAFRTQLESLHDGFTQELKDLFDPHADSILHHTYVACFSEHYDEEDIHGRLSMWRAYGQQCGVAMVMNNAPFLTPSDALNAWTVPVLYVGSQEAISQFDTMANAISENRDLFAQLPREQLLHSVFFALLALSISTKHIGFKEEAEWRVVHMPTLFPSTKLLFDHEVVAGIPQPVFKIPLQDFPDEGFEGARLPALLERLVIGPTQFPMPIWTAMVQLLTKAGVEEAASKVVCSGVRLRT